MPSASTKPEKQASVDGTGANKEFLVVIDKKIRNLEKKKTKLDTIREKLKDGATLNSDQTDAISKYDGVILNLDFVRMLHKEYAQFLADLEKEQKRAKKRERVEQRAEEQRRLQEVLLIQNILDSMGSETAREDFTNGTNNAVKLTEEQLNSLDELYKLVSPSREEENDTDFSEQVVSSSEHLMNLVDRKEKDVLGTTYCALRTLLATISESGYFDTTPAAAVEVVEEQTITPDEETPSSDETAPTEEMEPLVEQNGVLDDEVDDTTPVVDHSFTMISSPTAADIGLVSDSTIIPDSLLSSQVAVDRVTETTEANIVDDSFFAAAPAFPGAKLPPAKPQRPANEIVSSVAGNFAFLQDSEIDPESPHMDPAVLAAHPLTSHHSQQQDLTQTTSLSQQQTTFQQMLEEQPSQQTTTDYSSSLSQSYGQSLMSQQLTNAAVVSPSKTTTTTLHESTSTTTETPDVPQPIPMPNQQEVELQQQQVSDEKKFLMNANAPVFRSMYTGEDGSAENDDKSNAENTESSGFSRNGGNLNNRGRGRGGNRGNSSNGYQQRGGRGGGDRGGYRGGDRGGYNGSRGSSGRGSYQGGGGFPRNNDYNNRSTSDYQSYGSSSSSYNSGYQSKPNRGGRGGFNDRGRGGRGGVSSGGNRGNYGKPMGNFNNQQTTA